MTQNKAYIIGRCGEVVAEITSNLKSRTPVTYTYNGSENIHQGKISRAKKHAHYMKWTYRLAQEINRNEFSVGESNYK